MDKESKEMQLLRAHKAESGLSYTRLGTAIGVNHMTIYNWFRGKQVPSAIAKGLIKAYLLNLK